MSHDQQQSFLMCMGTRPEIIKMAPIYHEMKRRGIPVCPLHTNQKTDFAGRRLLLVTAHRRENWNGPLVSIAKAILQIATDNPDIVVVWPVHANPVVQNMVFPVFAGLADEINSRIHIIEPMNYPEMLKLLASAWMVLTDSGGIQEEAASLHIPILVLRDTTERPELIEVGAGRLVGTTQEKILENFNDLSQNPERFEKMKQTKNPFGDGTTAKQIVDVLLAS